MEISITTKIIRILALMAASWNLCLAVGPVWFANTDDDEQPILVRPLVSRNGEVEDVRVRIEGQVCRGRFPAFPGGGIFLDANQFMELVVEGDIHPSEGFSRTFRVTSLNTRRLARSGPSCLLLVTVDPKQDRVMLRLEPDQGFSGKLTYNQDIKGRASEDHIFFFDGFTRLPAKPRASIKVTPTLKSSGQGREPMEAIDEVIAASEDRDPGNRSARPGTPPGRSCPASNDGGSGGVEVQDAPGKRP